MPNMSVVTKNSVDIGPASKVADKSDFQPTPSESSIDTMLKSSFKSKAANAEKKAPTMADVAAPGFEELEVPKLLHKKYSDANAEMKAPTMADVAAPGDVAKHFPEPTAVAAEKYASKPFAGHFAKHTQVDFEPMPPSVGEAKNEPKTSAEVIGEFKPADPFKQMSGRLTKDGEKAGVA